MQPNDVPVAINRAAETGGDDAPHEECGVLGISTPHGDGVAQMALLGLFALQHRGREAARIAVSDGMRARMHKAAGMGSTVFTPEIRAPRSGSHAIRHTRTRTTRHATASHRVP